MEDAEAGESDVVGHTGELDGAVLDGGGVAGERREAEVGVAGGASPGAVELPGALVGGNCGLRGRHWPARACDEVKEEEEEEEEAREEDSLWKHVLIEAQRRR